MNQAFFHTGTNDPKTHTANHEDSKDHIWDNPVHSDESCCSDDLVEEESFYDYSKSFASDIQMNFLHRFDHVFWAGDFNFRIFGTRSIVDSLLTEDRHDVLVSYDQLNMLMRFGKTFIGFAEGPLSFRPTYKFDKNSGMFDREVYGTM